MTLKPYKSIFFELDRASKELLKKGSHLPEKESVYDKLEKYKDDPNIYISFRDIEKIGINPQSKYDTPNGIYTYPLKKIWGEFDHSVREVSVPFAGDQPFVYVVKGKGRGIPDLSKYSESDLKKDLKKLKKEYGILFDEAYKSLSRPQLLGIPGRKLWEITYHLSQKLNKKPPVTWNLIFSKVLGYGYVCDLEGNQIIHENEPTQCVFFGTKYFDVLDVIDNVNKRGNIIKKRNIENVLPKWVVESGNHPIEWKIKYQKGMLTLIWKKGTWMKGFWYGGIWEDGTWEDGTWKSGTWNRGLWDQDIWGKWLYGIWKFGVWKNGIWKDGIWKDGTWKDGIWNFGNWKDGWWRNGIWKDGLWKNGRWDSGTWEKGTWKKGTWKDGIWESGLIYDPQKLGNFQPDWEWEGDYVISLISPKEYFGSEKSPYTN